MSIYEVYDPKFRSLTVGNAQLEKVYTGTRWAEGPVWFADGQYLLFSDIPNNRMLRFIDGVGVSVFRSPSNYSNGNTRDRQGRLVTCEHGSRSVTRTELDGSITTLVDRYNGKRLNSPNDVIVHSDGSIWFTDPPYGILSDYEGYKAEPEQAGNYVYRFDPATGKVTVVADDFDKPNGLAFSPDESILYIADSGRSHGEERPHHIRAFSVGSGGKLTSGRVFAVIDPGLPDGFRVDSQGNVWTSCADGVLCYDSEGTPLGEINVPETVSNLTFAGRARNRLFMTATTSVYSIYVNASGVARP